MQVKQIPQTAMAGDTSRPWTEKYFFSLLTQITSYLKVKCLKKEENKLMLLIPNATTNWTKSKLFLPAHPENQQSYVQENSVRHMLYETSARICNKRMLILQDCVKFHGRRRTA